MTFLDSRFHCAVGVSAEVSYTPQRYCYCSCDECDKAQNLFAFLHTEADKIVVDTVVVVAVVAAADDKIVTKTIVAVDNAYNVHRVSSAEAIVEMVFPRTEEAHIYSSVRHDKAL
jgi:hypothetical protein